MNILNSCILLLTLIVLVMILGVLKKALRNFPERLNRIAAALEEGNWIKERQDKLKSYPPEVIDLLEKVAGCKIPTLYQQLKAMIEQNSSE